MTITSIPKTQMPREKLLKMGPAALTDTELLAIFLRTGVAGKNVLMLADELIDQFGSLHQLLNAQLSDFQHHRGLGQAKYAQLQAILEMARRCLFSHLKQQPLLNNSIATRRYLQAKLAHYQHEVFACLFLNSQHKIIRYQELFHGSIDSAEVPIRNIAKLALKYHAKSLIIAHNHPSGDPTPSQADRDLTATLREALQLFNINLLDHIIIAANRYSSFAEQALL